MSNLTIDQSKLIIINMMINFFAHKMVKKVCGCDITRCW